MERLPKEMAKVAKGKRTKKKGALAPFFLQNLLTKN
jgi:hypothetical protein